MNPLEDAVVGARLVPAARPVRWGRAAGAAPRILRLPAAAGVRAVAVCPPDGPGGALRGRDRRRALGGAMTSIANVPPRRAAAALRSPRAARAMGRAARRARRLPRPMAQFVWRADV